VDRGKIMVTAWLIVSGVIAVIGTYLSSGDTQMSPPVLLIVIFLFVFIGGGGLILLIAGFGYVLGSALSGL
jgi:hypothetical protein